MGLIAGPTVVARLAGGHRDALDPRGGFGRQIEISRNHMICTLGIDRSAIRATTCLSCLAHGV